MLFTAKRNVRTAEWSAVAESLGNIDIEGTEVDLGFRLR
jgi:hypothetical protein